MLAELRWGLPVTLPADAFGHDLHHDGTARDPSAPFRLELIAAEATTALMHDAGLDDVSRAAIEVMILTTESGEGYRYLTGRATFAGRFAALADLLPSAGTSTAAYRARTAKLEREVRLPAGALAGDAASTFFDRVVERRLLAAPTQLFVLNLDAIVAEAGIGIRSLLN